MIHVARGASTLGTFSEAEVRDGLRSGRFMASDLGWREGMGNWQPLSQFPEFASEAGAEPGAAPPPPPPPPVTSTITPATTGPTPEIPAPRSGLPWERRREIGLFSAFFETVTMVLTKPAEAFTVMRTEGGFGDPLLFGVIGGSIGAIIWILMSAALHSFGWAAGLSQQNSLETLFGAGVSGMMLVVRLIITPLIIVVGLFIWSALVHVFLMMAGGANKTFETTFRTLSFAYGATSLFAIIPCCGGLVALIWGLVADCIGISRSHETDISRAVMAVLLPLIVCCGGLFLLCVMLGIGVGALMQHSGG